MAQQTLSIRFDLSGYPVIYELIENQINVNYRYQAPFYICGNDGVFVSREKYHFLF